MSVIFAIAWKDLVILWRDKGGMFWLLGFPLLYAVFFGFVFSGGDGDGPAGSMQIAIIDEDQSDLSRRITKRLVEHDAVEVSNLTLDEAVEQVRKGQISAYIVIHSGYGGNLGFGGEGDEGIEVTVDPSRTTEGGYLQGILMQSWFQSLQDMLTDFNRARDWIAKGRTELGADESANELVKTALFRLLDVVDRLVDTLESELEGESAEWGGPAMSVTTVSSAEEGNGDDPQSPFEIFFPIAILWGMFGAVMGSAIRLVRERTSGTMTRLSVAPITRAEILGGSGLSGFITCVGVMFALLMLGHFVFGVRLTYPLRLAVVLSCNAICFVGISMLLASAGKTEEAVGGSSSAVMLIMMMLGGAMVPRFVMPAWLQNLSHISPIKWAILSVEGATWREFSYVELMPSLAVLLGTGAVCMAIGILLLRRSQA